MDLSSYGLRVVEAEGKGRCLVAERRFEPGDVALISYPWVCCVCPSQAASCCALCLRRQPITKCSGGCGFGYCSDACREADLADHAVECRAIQLLENRFRLAGEHLWHNGDGVLNALLLARAARAQVPEDAAPSQLATPFKGRPKALRAMMSTPRLSIPVSIAEATLDVAATQAGLLPKTLGATREEQIEVLVGLLFQQQVNACGVLDPSRFEVTGEGLFVEGALVNHSCQPNCQHLYRWDKAGSRPTQYLQVTEVVTAGQELFISYGDHARPVWERRGRFQRSHWFTCRCSRCEVEMQPAGIREQARLVADLDGRVLPSLVEATAQDAKEAAAVLKAFQAAGVSLAPTVVDRRVAAARSRAADGPRVHVNAFRLESVTHAAANGSEDNKILAKTRASLKENRAALREVSAAVNPEALVLFDLRSLALARAEAVGDATAVVALSGELLQGCSRTKAYGELHPRRCALLALRQVALATLGREEEASDVASELKALRARMLVPELEQPASFGAPQNVELVRDSESIRINRDAPAAAASGAKRPSCNAAQTSVSSAGGPLANQMPDNASETPPDEAVPTGEAVPIGGAAASAHMRLDDLD